jgi:AICAR transformylase/IMP cyclohydrolase PurH
MNDVPLRYGCNPHQSPAHLYMPDGHAQFQVLNGQPDRAAQSNVQYVAHAGGAMRDMEVREAANDHGIRMIETGLRCFLH